VEELFLPGTERTWGYYLRQTEINTAEPLVPKPSASEFELAIEKLKIHKSPGIDQIPAELIKAGGKTIPPDIHELIILFGIGRNYLGSGRSRSFYLSIRREMKQTVVILIGAYHFCQLHTKFYATFCSQC
jgi:hypothetical protein